MGFSIKSEGTDKETKELLNSYVDYLADSRSIPIMFFLQELNNINFNFVVTCFGRTESNNKQVEGAKKSKHLTNQAIDVRIVGRTAGFSNYAKKNFGVEGGKNISKEDYEKAAQDFLEGELKRAATKFGLKIVYEGISSYRTNLEKGIARIESRSHYHIAVDDNSPVKFPAKSFPSTKLEGNLSKVFSDDTDKKYSAFVEAEDIVDLEDKGFIDIPFAIIHTPNKKDNVEGYRIRIPVFRTGLSRLEVVCRILAKYKFEVHVNLDPSKNNLLPLPLSKALFEYIEKKESSGQSNQEKTSLKVREVTKTLGGNQLKYLEFNPNNIIEVEDGDYTYYGDNNFLHFYTSSVNILEKTIGELYPIAPNSPPLFFYKKIFQGSEKNEGSVDTIFVTNFDILASSNTGDSKSTTNDLDKIIKKLKIDDKVKVSIAPQIEYKRGENDIDFCTKVCAVEGAALVTSIKSIRVDIIDYVSVLSKFEPVVFVLPKPNEPLFSPTSKRPLVNSEGFANDITLPFAPQLFDKVIEQYEQYRKDENSNRVLTKISLPVWNFSSDIDLNAMGTGFITTQELNQNVNFSKIFSLEKPISQQKKGEDNFNRYRLNSSDSKTQLVAQAFFGGSTSNEELNDFFNKFGKEYYKDLIANHFELIESKKKDSSLPNPVANPLNWGCSFTTFGIPFFQPGMCYELENFLPDFFYKQISFSPNSAPGIFRWRWRCVEVTHNFGSVYTMDVKLSV